MSWTRARPPHPYDFMPQVAEFTVHSSDLHDGDVMPLAHRAASRGGANRSPGLKWSGPPDSAASFAVTCFDIDAPTPSGVWHWIVTDIPPDASEVVEAADFTSARTGGRLLRNDLGTLDYVGAAPPEGDHLHRYLFTVHALRVAHLPVPDAASTAIATFILGTHTVARAHMVLTV
jgi:Raf kinase inhibitor-like YbhB/YbcL family protein